VSAKRRALFWIGYGPRFWQNVRAANPRPRTHPMSRLAALLILLCPALAHAQSITTLAGTGQKGHTGDNGTAAKATLNQPFHCEVDRKGNLYIAEAENHCIRKVKLATGVITTVAGTGKKGYT